MAKKKPARKAPAKKAPAKKAPAKKPPAKKAPAKKPPAKKPPAKKPAAVRAAPAVRVPTTAKVLGAMIGRDRSLLVGALEGVDWERVARYLLGLDWSGGHFARFRWSNVLGPLDAKAVDAARRSVVPALRKADLRVLARALRKVDWKSIASGAPLESVHWSGEVIELVVAVYNREKTEVVCPMCRHPYRDVFGRLFRMEKEISGREVPLLCPFEGEGQSCPPDLAADSWTRLDDLTGQDGRAVRTDGLMDRSITRSKIAFDLSDVPEGGGRVAMRDEERERIHAQHAGRVPAEPVSPEGVLMVGLAGFRSTDEVQIVASGFTTDRDDVRRPVVLDWELNETNSEVTFTVRDAGGEILTDESRLVTIDWIATTR